LSFAGTAWLVLEGWGLYGIAAGLILRAIWSAGANGLRCIWLLRHVFGLRPRWDGGLFRSLWRDSLHLFVVQVVLWVRLYFDRPLVAAILGPSAALVYSITMQVHETMRLLVLTLGAASIPGLAHLFGEGHLARFSRVIALRYEIQAAAAAIGLGGVIAFNGAFIALWIEPAVYAGDVVNLLAALATCSFILSSVPYDGLWARGEFALLSKMLSAEAVVRLSSMGLLILAVGMAGAPAAALVAQTLLLAGLAVLLARRVGQPLGELARIALAVLRVGLPVLVVSLAMLALLPRAADWLTLVLEATGFVAVGVLLVAALDPSLVRFVLRRGRDPIEPARA
jgi:O-antigen/teichoic acid export membrane protein